MLGGGTFTYYNKILPGTYTRYFTNTAPTQPETTGITAGALNLDWAPDGKVFQITADDFHDNAERITGHAYDAKENLLLREIFRHATSFIGYRLNSGGKKATSEAVGEALYSGAPGNKITVSVLRNVNNEEKFDVTTYFDGKTVDTQRVGQASRDEIALTKGQENSGTAVESATATFAFDKNQVKVTFANVPEGYKHTVRVKGQIGSVLAFVPGRFEESVSGLTHTVTYSPGAPINGTMTIEAVLTKDKITVINSCTYTCSVNEAVETGADASELVDNSYVAFNKTGLIPENAGYVFKGGTTKSSTTIQNHVDALNALEPYFFNALFCDSTDELVKELYASHTYRMRDTRGKYFQLYVYDYVKADNEAVVSIKNAASGGEKESDLVCWTAGYASAIDLSLEMTNKPYDGELVADVSYPEVQLELLMQQGHFLFHNIAIDDIRTLVDINTLQTYTADHGSELANNKVMRVIDYVHNNIEQHVNSEAIGNYKNNPEGRTSLWNYCCDLLKELWRGGVLRSYDSSDVEVLEIDNDKYSVAIRQAYDIEGTIRKVYVTTYIGNSN